MLIKRNTWLVLGALITLTVALLIWRGSALAQPTQAAAIQAADAPVELAGRTTFEGVLTDHELIFSPGDVNFCEAKATLLHVEKEQYELRLAETCGFGPRLAI